MSRDRPTLDGERATMAGVVVDAGDDGADLAVLAAHPAPPTDPTGGHTTRYERSPSDLIRLLAFVLATAALALGLVWADNVVLAFERDLLELADFLHPPAVRILDGLTSVLVVVVTLGAYVALLVLRRFRILGYVLAANVVASAATAAVLWAVDGARADTPTALNRAAAEAGVRVDDSLSASGLAQYVALFVVLAPFVSARWRRAGVGIVALLCTLRLVLSLHLPVDLALSVTIGAASGCAVLLAFGRPDQRPTPDAVLAGLRASGLDAASLRAAAVDARGSTPYLVDLDGGGAVFAKALSPKERSADLLYRGYRYVRLRSAGDERPFSSLRRAVEHEALVSLQARDVGVRTPRLRAIASVGVDSIVLAYDVLDGRSLDQVEGDLDDALLRATWEQVAILRRHRIAHRDLRRANLFVDDHGEPWLIDFGFSEVAASDQLLDGDVAQLLVSFALAVGARRSVAAAIEVLGPEAVGASARLLQPNALSGATKHALRQQHGLLDEVRSEVVGQAGIDEPTYVRLERFNAKTLLMLAMLAGATYFLLPQLGDVPGIIDQVDEADWWWFLPVIAASLVTYLGAAASLMGSVPGRLPAGPTLVAQVASSFTSRLAPSSVGGMALNLRFLQKTGVDTAVATSGIGLNAVGGVLVHLAMLVVFLVWAGRSAFDSLDLPDPVYVLYGLGAVLAVMVFGFAVPGIRHAARGRLLPVVRRSASGLRQVLRSPAKLGLLLGGSIAITFSNVFAMYFATEAFGGGLSFAQVGAVYLLGSAVASAAPTPGGLGAFEAAVIAGLVAAGMSNTVAVPSVFLFRLATFWLPVLPGWICFTYLQRRRYI